jgi:nitrite reductase/ring-hydroxylating ferredoxin subunit
MKYLQNCWYVAAWDTEVTATLFAREILGESILMYRKEDGTPVAISNRCPHRFAPLNKGKLIGDVVECPYHGLQFDSTGRCVKNPHPRGNGPIPPRARVTAYPLLEKWGALWIWMGHARPDESLLPDFGWLEQKDRFREIRGWRPVNAHYELLADNLLDLTRRPRRNDAGLGAFTRDLDGADAEDGHEGNTLWSRHSSAHVPAGPDLRRLNPGLAEGFCDKSNSVRWNAPGHVAIATDYWKGGSDREHLTSFRIAAMLTPADESRTWMFWSVARNFALDSEEVDVLLQKAAAADLAGSDVDLVEMQHRNLILTETLDSFTSRLATLPGDITPMRARRALRRMIDDERQKSAAQQDDAATGGDSAPVTAEGNLTLA